MNHSSRYLHRVGSLASAALLMVAAAALSSPASAQAPDALYIGDAGDNTVKRFDAVSGHFLGVFAKLPGAAALDQNDDNQPGAPRGVVVDAAGKLFVAVQNVAGSNRGEILRYSMIGAQLMLSRIVGRNDKNAPNQPHGILLSGQTLIVADAGAGSDAGKPESRGRILQYTTSGQFIGALTAPAAMVPRFQPHGLVVGPDGLLYVANAPAQGGQVLRFNLGTGQFQDVFISSTGGANELNRPEALVFGPDGQLLYVTSFQASAADTNKILVFGGPASGAQAGALLDQIALDAGFQPRRAFAKALLFGPGGALFVPIGGNAPDAGSVRRYDLGTKQFTLLVPESGQRTPLRKPWYLTFGQTNTQTLAYPAAGPVAGPNLQNCICIDGARIEQCAQLDCTSSAAQDAICGPVCATHGGESATGCLVADPICIGH